MLSNIKKYADNSETLKEARKNVKEMSLAKEIVVFIALFALIFFGTMLLNTILPVICWKSVMEQMIISLNCWDYMDLLLLQ